MRVWLLHNPDAGWSSPVARRTHIPEVAGSSPAPATNVFPGFWPFLPDSSAPGESRSSPRRGFLFLELDVFSVCGLIRPNYQTMLSFLKRLFGRKPAVPAGRRLPATPIELRDRIVFMKAMFRVKCGYPAQNLFFGPEIAGLLITMSDQPGITKAHHLIGHKYLGLELCPVERPGLLQVRGTPTAEYIEAQEAKKAKRGESLGEPRGPEGTPSNVIPMSPATEQMLKKRFQHLNEKKPPP